MQYNNDKLVTIENTQAVVERVVDRIRRAVVATMGPDGQLSAIRTGTSVSVTKDGVTVARSISFQDPIEDAVARVMIEPAIKTDVECGDGTTTTTMLTAEFYSLYRKFPKFIDHKFIDQYTKMIIANLTKNTILVNTDSPELYKLALTSSNNDEELSKIICDIFHASKGTYPQIEFKEANSNKDTVQRANGLPLRMVYSNPLFSPNGTGEDWTLNQFYPVVLDDSIRGNDPRSMAKFVADLMEHLYKNSIIAHVLLITRSIDNDYNSMLAAINAQNAVKGSFYNGAKVIGLQTNFGGSVGTSLMQDIATIFGVPMFTSREDVTSQVIPLVIENVTLGSSRSLVTRLSDPAKQRVEARIKEIKKQLETFELSEKFSPRARFNEARLRALNGELVTVLVGGETLSEIRERKDRFEDVSRAVQSALENGILPGVHTALIRATAEAERQLYEDFIANNQEISARQIDIIGAIREISKVGYKILVGEEAAVPKPSELDKIEVVNLATGEKGTPEALGIYDTAYASITALKGGVQTARLLATLSSILVNERLGAVKIG